MLQVLRSRVLRDRVARRAFHNRALEQQVDGFERHAFRLRHAHDGVDDHDDARAAEYEERAVRDVVEHDWRELCDDLGSVSLLYFSHTGNWDGVRS